LIGFVLFQKEKITTNEEDPQIEMGEMVAEIDEQYQFAEDQDDSSQGQNG
jgi:hypothetical protein